MNQHCQLIVFSNKAYNAIIDETFKKDPIETGGILLGHVLDNGTWIVMEVLPPGIYSTHEYAFFEYDDRFVNYLANSVASKYEQELSLLGLWHRHPGSMDFFSGTDDGTNAKFASLSPCGAISGLVNVDPKFRLTMRHVAYPLKYDIVDFEVGDDIIPEAYFELRHYPKTGLHPEINTLLSDEAKKNSGTNTVPTSEHPSNPTPSNVIGTKNDPEQMRPKPLRNNVFYWIEKILMGIGILAILFFLYYLFTCNRDDYQYNQDDSRHRYHQQDNSTESDEDDDVDVNKRAKDPNSVSEQSKEKIDKDNNKTEKEKNKDGNKDKKKKTVNRYSRRIRK